MTSTTWEVVIGLETHTQLRTQSKIFSGASIAFGASPNAQACPVDLALPGTLPVLNQEAVASFSSWRSRKCCDCVWPSSSPCSWAYTLLVISIVLKYRLQDS